MSAGLDYPGVGPEHALLQAVGRVQYEAARRRRGARRARGVLRGGRHPAGHRDRRTRFARRAAVREGSIPAARILIGLSGRGDKDMPTLQRTLLKGKL